ncbi:MAG: homoserine dehydrogenase [Vulcanimicrobiota bacterium]
MRPKIVLKFGGTSLATPESWRQVLDIIESKRSLNPVVVVSAVGSTKNRAKVTDLLQALAKDPKLGPLQEIHDGLLEALGLATDLLHDLWQELAEHLKARVSEAERLDRVMGWGERLSARMMAAALRARGWEAQDLSPSELGLISDDRFQDASILESSLEPIAQKIFQLRGLPVVPGYVGVTADGRPTTLGRGGSDYTAAVLGAALKREVEIFTDVDGVATTNPNFLPKAFRQEGHPHTIPQLSHEEAYQMAAFGSKVLYQKCLAAATMASRKGRHLRLTVKNTFNPEHPGTVLQGHRSPAGVPKGITALEGVPVLTVYLDREDDYRPLWRRVQELPGVRLLMASYSSGRASFVFDQCTAEVQQLEKEFPDSHLSKDQVLLKVVGDAIGENHQVLSSIHQSIEWLPRAEGEVVPPVHKSPQLLTDSTFEVVVRKRHFQALLLQLYRQLFCHHELYCGMLGLGTVGSGVLYYQSHLADSAKARSQWRFPIAAVRDADKKREHFSGQLVTDAQLVVDDPRVDVVLELMGGLEPARSLILKALSSGKHVVTANKAVLAEHGLELFAAARKAARILAFEASVCGEIPVLDVVRHMPSNQDVQGVLAIANGTSNYLLTHMAAGQPYEEVLAAAQRAGFAEADPYFDVSGADASQKLALLSSLIFHCWVPWQEIRRQGLEELLPVDFASAERFHCAIRPLSCARRTADGLELWTSPALVPLSHPLASVRQETNAVALQLAGRDEPFTMVGKGAGPLPTARSVVRDLTQLRQMTPLPPLQPAALRDWRSVHQGWYLRCTVSDQPGVFASVATSLAQLGLSIREATQITESEQAHIVLALQPCSWGQIEQVKQAISAHSWSREVLCLPTL